MSIISGNIAEIEANTPTRYRITLPPDRTASYVAIEAESEEDALRKYIQKPIRHMWESEDQPPEFIVQKLYKTYKEIVDRTSPKMYFTRIQNPESWLGMIEIFVASRGYEPKNTSYRGICIYIQQKWVAKSILRGVNTVCREGLKQWLSDFDKHSTLTEFDHL